VIRVLSDHNVLHTHTGHVAVGWLVVQDVLTVLALVAAGDVRTKDRSAVVDRDCDHGEGRRPRPFTAIVGTRVIPPSIASP
jgi:CPA2 family monovalent cation:H+ antiporter-2